MPCTIRFGLPAGVLEKVAFLTVEVFGMLWFL